MKADNLNIKKNTLLNLCYRKTVLKENCLIISVIQVNYFSEGLIVYIHKNKKHTIDLNNSEGLHFSN